MYVYVDVVPKYCMFLSFPECIFATIYSNNSYFISGFGAGNIYPSCLVWKICILLIIILLNTSTYIYNIFYFYPIMHCIT